MSYKLEELLLRWENLRRVGKVVSVDELCHDCPELSKQLLARIQGLERMNQVLDLSNDQGPTETPLPPPTRYDDLRPNSEPVPGYRLEKRLGKGGFGEVWKAIGPGGFSVALKFVSLNGELGARELRSLEVIKTLRHPNLLATFGSWQAHGSLVIAMELADRTLLDRLHEAREQGLPGIPLDELIRYMQEAAKGIDYLNQPDDRLGDSSKGAIQHRDIKPQNILLMGGGIKIGDFGLVRILKTTVTQHTGSLTLAYAAPEFFMGHTASSSDQYSLAVTYCQLRGGRLPFAGHPGQITEGHLNGTPDLTMLPKAERLLVLRALAKDAEKRWPTCAAFVNALKDCYLPTGIPQKRRKWSIALIVASSLLLGTLLLWLFRNGFFPSSTSQTPTSQDKATKTQHIVLDIQGVATCSTSKIFENSELLFSQWGDHNYYGVPFRVIDPNAGQTKNVICLHSSRGEISRQMPEAVQLPCKSIVKAIHLLGGVAGWAYPNEQRQTVSMIVSLRYEDGKTENHELINGIHITDWTGPDVPGSKRVKIQEQGDAHVRYLAIRPMRHDQQVNIIEFRKGNDDTAPLVIAVTIEIDQPDQLGHKQETRNAGQNEKR